MGQKRAHLRISGIVQGVCFRWETTRSARALGVTGWVRNRSDGSVEVVCEGDRANVEAFIDWCRKGPQMARVDAIQLEWGSPLGGFEAFEVIR
ncbi:MAG: acylphosphatase [Desulfobacterales bacterium]|nr:acylphosphatase [Desulfobacterales bacterium]